MHVYLTGPEQLPPAFLLGSWVCNGTVSPEPPISLAWRGISGGSWALCWDSMVQFGTRSVFEK